MPVLISARTRRASRPLQRQLCRLATTMLAWLDCEDRELSVMLCNDSVIRTLNEQYRDQPKATDVLAFGSDVVHPTSAVARSRAALPTAVLLGDVVISLQTAERQAREHDASLLQETAFLLAHGLLHLLGMDHDTPRKAAAMNRRTAELLRAVGLSPPIGVRALASVPRPQRTVKPRKHRPKVRSRRGRTSR
jgi:probable rRNA maturation factor